MSGKSDNLMALMAERGIEPPPMVRKTSAPTGFAAMSHESHGACFCSADGHCPGGSTCAGKCAEPDQIDDCDATYDVAPDGVLHCTRESGHPGHHLGAVWWIPRAPALDVIVLSDLSNSDSSAGAET